MTKLWIVSLLAAAALSSVPWVASATPVGATDSSIVATPESIGCDQALEPPSLESQATPTDSATVTAPADSTASLAAGDSAAAPESAVTVKPQRSRNILRDSGRALGILGSDAWYIVSSPARLDKRGAVVAAATLGITAVLYTNDDLIYRTVVRNRHEPIVNEFLNVGETAEPVGLMGNMNKYYLGAMVLGYAFKIEPLTVIPAQIIESHIIAGGLRNILKPLVGRTHPYEGKGSRNFEFNEGTSFPSGHTSVVFEIATILSHHAHLLPVTIAAYGAATAVAFQRIDSSNHWASDVFFPAVTGTFIAKTICSRRDDRKAMAVVPVFRPDGFLGVQVSRGF